MKDLNEMQLKGIELDYISELENLIEEEGDNDVMTPVNFISVGNNVTAKVSEYKTKFGKFQKMFTWGSREFYIYLIIK